MERHDRLTLRAVAVVLAAAVAGLLFAPVFGLLPLLLPVLVPAAAVLAVTLLCTRRPALVDWRPLLAALAGVLAVAETLLFPTTLAGLPTGGTLRALAGGVIDSWQLVLQSTWPARPDPDLLIFVPLLVVVAAVLGAEVLLRLRAPLPALLPSLAVVVLSQVYAAQPPGPAAVSALAYAAVAGLALATGATFLRVGAAAVVSVLAAGLTMALLPAAPARYSLQHGQAAPLVETLPDNPLDGIAARLEHPNTEVFRVEGGAGVDRWPLVVLDGFDGANWTPSPRYRRLGTELPPGPAVTVDVRLERAKLTVAGTGGPWLPSQTWPASVEGIAPYVAERDGSLLLPGTDGAAEYYLNWWQPEVAAAALGDAPIDPLAPGGLDVGDAPEDVEDIPRKALGELRPSFRAALVLEEYLRTNYAPASAGQNLPSGHAWPQLRDFLLFSHRGTSEQFAAAYVALARMAGIPARLVVGFRMPAERAPDDSAVVHNRDVLAWPEVAVQDVGWVPLDPIGSATGAKAGSGLAGQAQQARAQLPPPEQRIDQPVTPVTPPSAPGGGSAASVPWMALLAVPLLPLVGWPVGVPAAWMLRSWRRRRRQGTAAVLGAWAEARDRLRAYGVVVTPGMTVRDLSTAAGPVTDPETVDEIRRLAVTVDRALWSGGGPAADDDATAAWASVRAVRRGLARRGPARRVWAVLNPRPLLPVTASRSRRGSPSTD